jgi:hypothetical protein
MHGDQGARFQVRAAGVQGSDDHLADCRREYILRADLDHARLARLSGR